MEFHLGEASAQIGDENRKKIRKVLQDNLGITVREVCQIVDLGPAAVRRHIKSIRKEWEK